LDIFFSAITRDITRPILIGQEAWLAADFRPLSGGLLGAVLSFAIGRG
jgi:hypothetical protein